MSKLADHLEDLPPDRGARISHQTMSHIKSKLTSNNFGVDDPLQLAKVEYGGDYGIDDDIDPRDTSVALSYALQFTRENRPLKADLNNDLKASGGSFPIFGTLMGTLLGEVAAGPAGPFITVGLATVSASKGLSSQKPQDVLARDDDVIYLLERLGRSGTAVMHCQQLLLFDPHRHKFNKKNPTGWVIHDERHVVVAAEDESWIPGI